MSDAGIVWRFDRAELAPLEKPVRRDDGMTVYHGRIARTGVQTYTMADGSTRRELRHPDDVFDPESVASFRLVPVTDGHPRDASGAPFRVDATNAKAVARGAAGENFRRDGAWLVGPLAVHDAALVARTDAGATALSAGYVCAIDPTPGVYDGEAYDVRQRRIRANHVAFLDPRVEAPRAGAGAQVRADAIGVQTENTGAQKMTTRKIEIAGVAHEVPEAVAARFDALTAEAATATARAQAAQDALTANEKAAATVRADAEKAIAEASAKASAALEAAVAEAIAVREKARAILGVAHKIDGVAIADLRKQVVAKAFPDVVLEGKPDIYVSAMFDAAKVPTGLDKAASAIRGDGATVTAERVDGTKNLAAYVAQQNREQAERWRKPLAASASK